MIQTVTYIYTFNHNVFKENEEKAYAALVSKRIEITR